MKVAYLHAAAVLGVSPLQVLVELAAMNQPWEECWPAFDEGYVDTLRARRRLRMGFVATPERPTPRPSATADERLPVSELAAAILDKLLRKGYGLKSVRVSTLVQKWVHGTTEEQIWELVQRGNIEWTEGARGGARSAVNLVTSRLPDTEHIVEVYRRQQAQARP